MHCNLLCTFTYQFLLRMCIFINFYFNGFFLCPRDRRLFLSCLSFCHHLKTLTLLITFEQWVLELWYVTWVFLVIRPIIFYPVTLTLEFDPFFENFNLANNFLTMSAKALIFHMSFPCDKTFPWVPLFFFPLWPWTRSLTHFLKTLTLLITFEQ